MTFEEFKREPLLVLVTIIVATFVYGTVAALMFFVFSRLSLPFWAGLLAYNLLLCAFGYFVVSLATGYRRDGDWNPPNESAAVDSPNPLIGKQAVAKTSLRPSGRVCVDDQFHDALSKDGYIEVGATVVIVGCAAGALRVEIRRDPLPVRP
ncbi:MAG: NfeD family protein [Opitutales bacterium]|nr:NfeD family protein [Opitutales bacterium]